MTTDIDLPFLPSAAQIRRREFASVRRGYDPDQVRDYLAQVAEQVDNLEGQLREARLEEGGAAGPPQGPPPSEDPYERLSKRMTTLLATADQEAEGILAEARADAARMVNEARTEADRIRVDAQAHAEEVRQESNELLEKAKEESDRVLAGLSSRRENMVQQLQDMQDRLLGVAKELQVAIGDPTAEKVPAKPKTASAPASTRAETQRESEDAVDSLEGMLDDDGDGTDEGGDGMDLPDLPPLEFDFDDDDE